ncbi:hypothetical protein [Embleya sp. NPDC005971]|uniref:WXG100-like domain-containing protein n=1 Tax=Embleya sp. NPDC005971 TaxID=3156724 RepID=UPI0033FD7744
MTEGFEASLERLMVTARGFSLLRERIDLIANGLANDLGGSAGMAGDDGAGNAFAEVYQPAARATVDQIGFAAAVMGETSATVMRTAANYLATEDAVAASMLQANSVNTSIDMMRGPANDPCNSTARGRDLPHIVDEQGSFEKVVNPSKGNRGKLSAAGGNWRSAAGLVDRVLADAQEGARTMLAECRGTAMEGFDAYFKLFVGYQHAPNVPTDCATPAANLAAACRQIAQACDNYAAHVKRDQNDFHFPPRVFGGDDDLKNAVLSDPAIRVLGDLPPILDSTRARVVLPQGGGAAPGLPGLPPVLPVPVPIVPVPVALASTANMSLAGFFTGTFGQPPPVDPTLITPPLPPPPPEPRSSPRRSARDSTPGRRV